MKRRVAVVGTGQTECKTRNLELSFPGLVHLAVRRALEDAELAIRDIDAVVFGSSPEYFEGVNQPELWCGEYAGALNKPYYRVHTGGTVGAATGMAAVYQVASGMFDTVLAVTSDKLSEGVVQLGLSTVYDPIFGRDFACGAPSAVAIQSRWYMKKSGATENHSAIIAVKNRLNALNNPYAHLKIPNITTDMVLKSPFISSPLRLLDVCPASDGACAMIFANEERAKRITKTPAWVKGVSSVAEGVGYTNRDWAKPIALNAAAKKAYQQAGITNPLKELDVAEIYEAFTYQEMIWSEGMFFCEENDGWKLAEEGVTQMTGDLPINPSGGVLSTNTIGASAMMRQCEAALQVMGKADKRQVDGVKTALAHGWGGGIQFHSVMILGKEPN
jgi:acetyl-CoA C-acetyltransferase